MWREIRQLPSLLPFSSRRWLAGVSLYYFLCSLQTKWREGSSSKNSGDNPQIIPLPPFLANKILEIFPKKTKPEIRHHPSPTPHHHRHHHIIEPQQFLLPPPAPTTSSSTSLWMREHRCWPAAQAVGTVIMAPPKFALDAMVDPVASEVSLSISDVEFCLELDDVCSSQQFLDLTP